MAVEPTTTANADVEYVQIEDFDNFSKYCADLNSTGPPTYFYFSGKKDDTGHSWCPDCVEGKFFILFCFTLA